MAVPRDRRTLGQTNTLLESGVDLERLRQDRLHKVQVEMKARDIGALLLTDTINIRYTTGVNVMPIWTATNLAHYVLVPTEGSPVIFEMASARFRAEEIFSDVRNAHYWQTRFAEQMAAERSVEWATEIKDVLGEWGADDAKLGVDRRDTAPRMPLQLSSKCSCHRLRKYLLRRSLSKTAFRLDTIKNQANRATVSVA